MFFAIFSNLRILGAFSRLNFDLVEKEGKFLALFKALKIAFISRIQGFEKGLIYLLHALFEERFSDRGAF